MRSVKEIASNEMIVHKSRFIGLIFPVDSELDIQNLLKSVKTLYPDATHYCYAYVLGEDGLIQKASDDGEPQKTAGFPMLDVLKKQDLTNVLAVVVRYFGGVLLGAGGLIRSYSKSVSSLMNLVTFTHLQESLQCEMTIDYQSFAQIEKYFREIVIRLEITYTEFIHVEFEVLDSDFLTFEKNITNYLHGKDIINVISKKSYYQ
ncbi:MAG: YigZ family protein [Candidatus Izemoplasmatales bacterium]|nr:YigZ family protein [Candidatus Izemoplasmatales bacterium]